MIEGTQVQVVSYINEQLQRYRLEGIKTGVIATDETKDRYLADSIKSVGKREDEEQIARQLFKILREFDDDKVQMIYAESFESRGVGVAIMNRLLKAAGHQVIYLQ